MQSENTSELKEKVLGITQVQVSRLEKQILETMKRKICK